MKRALISGITGQDGSYLAELLLDKGYEVHGIIRRASQFNTQRIDHLYQDPHKENVRFFLHYGDLTDSSNVNRLVEKVAPNEIYNLGAQSHVQVSFEVPEYTAEVDAIGTLRFLDAIKATGKERILIDARYFRPTEVDQLLGDPGKAKRVLNWQPKVTFDALVDLMVKADCKASGVLLT